MVSVCFYFQVHQPFRIRQYRVFDIGKSHDYFDDEKNKEIMQKVAQKCYLPMNKLILNLIKQTEGRFRASFSITGTALEQMEQHSPEVIESFKQLAKTGCVDFLNETYYHSLAFLHSEKEFEEQIKLHQNKIKTLFGKKPVVFRNTELIFNNALAKKIESLGYKGILAEGADHILKWRSPNYVYTPVQSNIKALLKNYHLSDDLAFRFSERTWKDWPLTVEKYTSWINKANSNGNVINLFMDYETFGEHQWHETGIFDFMEQLPSELLKHPDNEFVTVNQAIEKYESAGEIDVHLPVSWADIERDTSAWTGNKMQQSALKEIYLMENMIKRSNDKTLLEDWRKLQTSDHFYYMCTKWFADGDVHKYFNPYESPYDAYIAFMNIMQDLQMRLKEKNRLSSQIRI